MISGTLLLTSSAAGVFNVNVTVSNGTYSATLSVVIYVVSLDHIIASTILLLAAPPGFTYDYQSGPTFSGKKIAYDKIRLDITYPKTGTPVRGSFSQVNTITTVVITAEKDGKLKATTETTYILDQKKLMGQKAYFDTMSGPMFDKDLAGKAFIVFEFVTKEHGFTKKNVADIGGSTPETKDDNAVALRKTFDPTLATGTYTY